MAKLRKQLARAVNFYCCCVQVRPCTSFSVGVFFRKVSKTGFASLIILVADGDRMYS